MRLRFWMSAFCLLALSACGGGGGGTSDAFSLSRDSVSAKGYYAEYFSTSEPPAPEHIVLKVRNNKVAEIGAAYVGREVPDWLNVSITGSGSDYLVELEFERRYAPGQLSTVVTLGAVDTAGKLLQAQEVKVSYDVVRGVSISPVGADSVHDFVFGHSTTMERNEVRISQASGKRWKLESDTTWVRLDAATGSGDGRVGFTINAGELAEGFYSPRFTITNLDDPQEKTRYSFGVRVEAPLLAFHTPQLLLGGDLGRDVSAQPVTISLGTGENRYPFSVEVSTNNGISWLQVESDEDLVGGVGTSLRVNADRVRLDPGLHSGLLRPKAVVRGISHFGGSMPVQLSLDRHRLLASTRGVAFVSQPSNPVLERSLTIRSSFGLNDVPWQAEASQPWLTATASGMTGQAIHLKANAAGLATNRVHQAEVWISSTDPRIRNSETIRVALWIGDDPEESFVLEGGRHGFVASPVEPWVFVVDTDRSLRAYNVHTGELVRNYGAFNFSDLTIRDDGAIVFGKNDDNDQVTAINVLTGTTSLIGAGDSSSTSETIHYARPSGEEILFAGDRILRVSDGYYLAYNRYSSPHEILSISEDGRSLASQRAGDTYVRQFEITDFDYTAVRSFPEMQNRFIKNNGALGVDLSLAPDGSSLYVIADNTIRSYDARNGSEGLSFAATQPWLVVRRLWNGLLFGIASGTPGTAEAYQCHVFDAQTGLEKARFPLSRGTVNYGLSTGQPAASGDGTRVVVAVYPPESFEPALLVHALPPP